VNGKPVCSCPSFKYRQNCKHITVYEAEEVFGIKPKKKYQTPQEAMKERAEASKIGKKIAPLVGENPSYKTTEEKVEEDPELAKFMDDVS